MSLRSSRERDGSTGLVPGNPSEPERGTAELTRCGWGGAGCPPETPPFTSISAFASPAHNCILLVSLSCSVCFSFSFLSLISFLYLFSLLLLVRCVQRALLQKLLLPPSATSTWGSSPFLNTEQCDELNHRNKPAR